MFQWQMSRAARPQTIESETIGIMLGECGGGSVGSGHFYDTGPPCAGSQG